MAVAVARELSGPARLGRRTKLITKTLASGEIAVLDHRDLDRVSAEDLIAAGVLARTGLAGKPNDQVSEIRKPDSGEAVFVTGSLIPQRIKRKPIGTTTVSPIRIIDRHEIDTTGRRAARGVLIADPSVTATGR